MSARLRTIWMVGLLLGGMTAAAGEAVAQAPAAAELGFEQYAARVQAVAQDGPAPVRPAAGNVVIEERTPANGELAGAMLHHWRGTAFAPGARAAEFDRLMREFGRWPHIYSPQVKRARQTGGAGDHLQMTMRVEQKHGITVVMDTDYDVTFGRKADGGGWMVSRSTRVAEIDRPGTAHERALGPEEEHGFLWRQITGWRYEKRDGGLVLQVDSVTLTRGIPAGLGWAVRPFVESVPRESLEFTLSKTVAGLKPGKGGSKDGD